MALSFYWPPGLPQNPQESFSETGGVLVLRTPMDAGPAKQRRRGKRTNSMQCSFYMTSEQVQLLENFIENVIMGTTRFGFIHPRTQQVVEVRIVPQQDGEMFSSGYITKDWWNVGLTFEMLP